MNEVDFFGWKIRFKDELRAIKDNDAKEIIIIEGILELNAMIRIDEHGELQIKPTWDTVVLVNPNDNIITIRHANKMKL
ncbi:hypothetical protein [Lysinibacillus sp. TE18511]